MGLKVVMLGDNPVSVKLISVVEFPNGTGQQ
jgi:hypothetical protein